MSKRHERKKREEDELCGNCGLALRLHLKDKDSHYDCDYAAYMADQEADESD
jgi:hypothetical protein